jgi:hypothetical protein
MLFAAEGGRAMLVELSVMEQRYQAVMEVVSGAPVTEVARWYGISPRREISIAVIRTLGTKASGTDTIVTASLIAIP